MKAWRLARRFGQGPIGWRDHVVGAAIAAVYFAVLFATADDLAMSRDESFYTRAAESYGAWFDRLFQTPSEALEQSFIDRKWRYNHEHPSLVKSLFALSWLAHRDLGFLDEPGTAIRLPGILSSALLLWLIYLFGARTFDRRVGVFGALVFALLPRVFYHAHLAAFDVPITLMSTWVAYCYWRALGGRRIWLLWLGISYGLALATKHNAWILPGVFLVHWLWTVVGELQARRRAEGKHVGYVPWWLIAMLLVGPPIFLGSWPWLWDKTWDRFVWYANFHLNHTHYNYAYFGENLINPPFPFHVPFVMTAFTVPVTTLVLSLLGIGTRTRALLPPGLPRLLWPRGTTAPDRRCTEVLWLGLLLAPLVAVALPHTPIFGGTKHWLTAYPFLALFAGVGFVRVADATTHWLPDRKWRRAAAVGGAGALLLAPAVVETAHSHPFGLAHYGVLAGGVPGAADKGMNRQFWGYTHAPLNDWFETRLPGGGSIWPCDATGKSWRMMHRDGMLRGDIRATGNVHRADYAIVHHELHFIRVDAQIWMAYAHMQPARVLRYDGVPLVSVYAHPRHRASTTDR